MKEIGRSNLFVYGTLKKGGKLHSVLGNSSEFLGVFRTAEDKFDMHDYGCPAMILKDNSFKIKGELYKVTPECMARVTTVECGAGYVPFIVDINEENYPEGYGLEKAIAFIYPIFGEASVTSGSNRVEEKDGVKEWNG